MNTVQKFRQSFERYCKLRGLLVPNEKILIAVSGGVDSVVLLDLLVGVQDKYQLQLKVIHLNHRLRGKEADADEAFVHQLGQQYGLSVISERIDVRTYAKKKKLSLEAGAREVRYDFFHRALAQSQFDKVATGHQADDQAETVLLHLLRGSGIRGLGGISPHRDCFIRPLLFASRAEILQYAQTQKLSFRQDASNLSCVYTRNRIRWKLIPYLAKQFNPQIVKKLNQLADIFRENEEFLSQFAYQALNDCVKYRDDKKIVLEINRFLGYFNIVKKYIVASALRELGLDPELLSFKKWERVLALSASEQKGKRVRVSPVVDIILDHAGLVIEKQSASVDFFHPVQPNKEYYFSDLSIWFRSKIEQREGSESCFSQNNRREMVDYDKLCDRQLFLRNIKPADRFYPLGMQQAKKISDFVIDEKIPLHERNRLLVLVTNRDEIVWLCGYRIDDRFKITPSTRRVLKLEIKTA
ncbi:tRNA lysidine(34) synthetase TilS [candidate division KSB1 bacterium]|nr:MAG: tRNA lysidine(34) synthetase TilS [candidate division KSB1 bacterium]